MNEPNNDPGMTEWFNQQPMQSVEPPRPKMTKKGLIMIFAAGLTILALGVAVAYRYLNPPNCLTRDELVSFVGSSDDIALNMDARESFYQMKIGFGVGVSDYDSGESTATKIDYDKEITRLIGFLNERDFKPVKFGIYSVTSAGPTADELKLLESREAKIKSKLITLGVTESDIAIVREKLESDEGSVREGGDNLTLLVRSDEYCRQ